MDKATNRHQAAEAIGVLLRSVVDALRRPGVLSEPFLPDAPRAAITGAYLTASKEYDEWINVILDAKAKLAASGFPVPDAWVHANIVHPVRLRRQRSRGYWLEIRHDERDDLEKLKAELRLAGRRLELEPDAKQDTAEDEEPLTETQQAVYDKIKADGPITGKQICNAIGTDQATLTSRIIPVLKTRRGVRNKRGAGYWVPSTP